MKGLDLLRLLTQFSQHAIQKTVVVNIGGKWHALTSLDLALVPEDFVKPTEHDRQHSVKKEFESQVTPIGFMEKTADPTPGGLIDRDHLKLWLNTEFLDACRNDRIIQKYCVEQFIFAKSCGDSDGIAMRFAVASLVMHLIAPEYLPMLDRKPKEGT